MPPKPRDREKEAVEAEEAKAAKRSRELFDAALDARLVSRVRPSSLTELKPSKVLKRSDCKDIHKRSSVKKSRYMTVFPGQLGNLKEGRLGSLAKLDTQNPVMYIEYPKFGRLKLCGTIVRSRATRYFTLNVKSKDRLNLEDWFDSMIVFSTCFWVGNAEENPGEEPRPFPEELKHVQAAAETEAPNAEKETRISAPAKLADFAFSVAAEEGAAPKKSVVSDTRDEYRNEGEQTRATAERAAVSLDQSSDEDADEDDRAAAAAAAARPARPRRESAKAARYDFSEVDDFELEEEEEEEEKVFRGRVTATVAKEAAPLAAPKRRSVGAASGAAKKARSDSAAEPPPAAAAARSASPSEVVAISDDDDDDDDAPPEPSRGAGGKQTSLLGFLGGKKAEAEAPRRASAGAPRAAAAAPKPSKKFVLDSDSDSDSDSEPEDEDSDFEA
jgi:hypothetical protein